MDLVRELGLELRDLFQQPMRHASAVRRVGRTAVANLLQDEVASRMLLKIRRLFNAEEVPPIAVAGRPR